MKREISSPPEKKKYIWKSEIKIYQILKYDHVKKTAISSHLNLPKVNFISDRNILNVDVELTYILDFYVSEWLLTWHFENSFYDF